MLASVNQSEGAPVRLVVPYNACLYQGMSGLLAGMQTNIGLLTANVVRSSTIAVSWKNDAAPLALVLRRMQI